MSPPASPFVSPDHWSYRVLRRLDHAGQLPPGADVARHTMPQEEIAAWLSAAQHSRAERYLQRFRREFAPPGAGNVVDASATLGYQSANDLPAPGIGYDSANWSGARAIPGESEPFGSTRIAVAFANRFAAAIGSRTRGGVSEAQLVATAGPAGFWIGRRELGYGIGEGGGLVVDANRFDGIGAFLTRAWRLPVLGPTRFETHVSRIDNVLNFNDTENEIEPWFWTARGSFEPIGDLRVGINRGMMFGGEGNLPVTFGRVVENIIGIYTSDDENTFANQVISVDFRYRVPGAPITAYLDWGSDDAAGGWFDVPGILGGVEVVHVDSAYDVAIGMEHLQFSASCCGNSIWYRNAWFRGSWADGEQLLGHPLGGHGREWRVFAHGGFSERVVANAAVFARRRRAENVFAPERQGKSTGAHLGADVGVTRSTRVVVDVEGEWGADDWNSSRALVAVRLRF